MKNLDTDFEQNLESINLEKSQAFINIEANARKRNWNIILKSTQNNDDIKSIDQINYTNKKRWFISIPKPFFAFILIFIFLVAGSGIFALNRYKTRINQEFQAFVKNNITERPVALNNTDFVKEAAASRLQALNNVQENEQISYTKREIRYQKIPSQTEADPIYDYRFDLNQPIIYETWLSGFYYKEVLRQGEKIFKFEVRTPDYEIQYLLGNKSAFKQIYTEKVNIPQSIGIGREQAMLNWIINSENNDQKLKLISQIEKDGNTELKFKTKWVNYDSTLIITVKSDKKVEFTSEINAESTGEIVYENKFAESSFIKFDPNIFAYNEIPKEIKISEQKVYDCTIEEKKRTIDFCKAEKDIASDGDKTKFNCDTVQVNQTFCPVDFKNNLK